MIQLKLDKNKRYLLACSFGPDSMALFYLLKENGYNFDCAIVNYHLRKESDNEVKGLLDYASQFNIKVHVLDVKEKLSKNVEAECRNIRYRFFKELTDQYGYDATLVAHHQDDLIETYLLQKERQNCPIFYGISEITVINKVNIIRPLLSFCKNDLLEICKANNVPYSVDVTNFELTFKRNKIRYKLSKDLTTKKRSEIMNEIKSKNSLLDNIFKSFDSELISRILYVLSLDKITQQYLLNFMAKKVDESLFLSKENVGQAIDILKSDKPNGQFMIKRGLYLIKEYGYYSFSAHKLSRVDYECVIQRPSTLETDYFYLDFSKDSKNRNVSLDDYPLTIRAVKPTDVIFINGYKVTARRLLIDWKVPFRKRLMWPVILNKNNVCVYIPRYRQDFIPEKDCNFYVK